MEMPFDENMIDENNFIRKFYQHTDSGELVWHRDREDRIVEAMHDTDWLVQIDNQLPKKFEGEIHIPKGVYHRLIKGTGDLEIKLQKLF
jgi:hypothetical protein